MTSKKVILFGAAILFIICLVSIATYSIDRYLVRNWQRKLYCESLNWGMSESEVKDELSSIGPYRWNERILREEDKMVWFQFVDFFLNHEYGGVVTFRFFEDQYIAVLNPIPVGEFKTICVMPDLERLFP